MLRIENAEIGYGHVPVVKDLSLFVDRGEAVCLVGPNGAGKSTSIRGVLGLNRLTSGSVHWKGQDITGKAPHRRARLGIGVVPEGRRVFPQLTVLENLDVSARISKTGSVTARIESALDRFPRLAERTSQLGGLLSGGEQQMLAIARALVQAPELLLIDELSLGLAPVIYQQVGEAVRSLAEDGLGVLLVEQNAMLAMDICSRGYLMAGGRIVLSGTVAEMSADSSMQDLYFGGLERSTH
jgi:branched-chain amino acid transport system ATP-binding protein